VSVNSETRVRRRTDPKRSTESVISIIDSFIDDDTAHALYLAYKKCGVWNFDDYMVIQEQRYNEQVQRSTGTKSFAKQAQLDAVIKRFRVEAASHGVDLNKLKWGLLAQVEHIKAESEASYNTLLSSEMRFYNGIGPDAYSKMVFYAPLFQEAVKTYVEAFKDTVQTIDYCKPKKQSVGYGGLVPDNQQQLQGLKGLEIPMPEGSDDEFAYIKSAWMSSPILLLFNQEYLLAKGKGLGGPMESVVTGLVRIVYLYFKKVFPRYTFPRDMKARNKVQMMSNKLALMLRVCKIIAFRPASKTGNYGDFSFEMDETVFDEDKEIDDILGSAAGCLSDEVGGSLKSLAALVDLNIEVDFTGEGIPDPDADVNPEAEDEPEGEGEEEETEETAEVEDEPPVVVEKPKAKTAAKAPAQPAKATPATAKPVAKPAAKASPPAAKPKTAAAPAKTAPKTPTVKAPAKATKPAVRGKKPRAART